MSSKKIKTRNKILDATWHLLEKGRGQGVNMRDIAEVVGISRQALYLHFGSRTELMIATAHHVDEVRGLSERIKPFHAATGGIELLETFVEFWGNYIPEIYGIGRVLMSARETDEAAAAAWDDRMSAVHGCCREIIEALDREGMLAPQWPPNEAIEMLWTILSVPGWEQLTIECGWSITQYIDWMKILLKRTFVDKTRAEK